MPGRFTSTFFEIKKSKSNLWMKTLLVIRPVRRIANHLTDEGGQTTARKSNFFIYRLDWDNPTVQPDSSKTAIKPGHYHPNIIPESVHIFFTLPPKAARRVFQQDKKSSIVSQNQISGQSLAKITGTIRKSFVVLELSLLLVNRSHGHLNALSFSYIGLFEGASAVPFFLTLFLQIRWFSFITSF